MPLRRVLRTLAVAVVAAACPSVAEADTTGSMGDRGDAFLSYTITGGNLSPASGAHSYEGDWAGGQITISGEMVVTRAKGYVSSVRMAASIGDMMQINDDKVWGWPADGSFVEVTDTTVTQPYTVTFDVPATAQATGATIEGGAYMSVCGGVCASLQVTFKIKVPKQGATPAPPQATPPTIVGVVGKRLVSGGQRVDLHFRVTDASGEATPHLGVYDGGTLIGTAVGSKPVSADGRLYDWNIRIPLGLRGPLFFCVWAENASGLQSVNAPKSSCKWLSLLVPIGRVSNHCGGAGWDSIVAIENYFGNTSSYYEPRNGRKYVVNFSRACDLHDAGYGGHTVRDTINRTRKHPSGQVIDFRPWNRERVDNKFLRDMQTLCRRQIPASAPNARRACVEGTVRFKIVRTFGDSFFDADPLTPGVQSTGPRDNT